MTTLITMIPMEIMNTLPHIASILLSCVRGITTFCTILSTTFFGGLGGGGGGGDGAGGSAAGATAAGGASSRGEGTGG